MWKLYAFEINSGFGIFWNNHIQFHFLAPLLLFYFKIFAFALCSGYEMKPVYLGIYLNLICFKVPFMGLLEKSISVINRDTHTLQNYAEILVTLLMWIPEMLISPWALENAWFLHESRSVSVQNEILGSIVLQRAVILRSQHIHSCYFIGKNLPYYFQELLNTSFS